LSFAHIIKFKENDSQKMDEKQKKYENLLTSKIEPHDYQCFNYKYLYNIFITNETQSKILKNIKTSMERKSVNYSTSSR